jgi:hypothetical protein
VTRTKSLAVVAPRITLNTRCLWMMSSPWPGGTERLVLAWRSGARFSCLWVVALVPGGSGQVLGSVRLGTV